MDTKQDLESSKPEMIIHNRDFYQLHGNAVSYYIDEIHEIWEKDPTKDILHYHRKQFELFISVFAFLIDRVDEKMDILKKKELMKCEDRNSLSSSSSDDSDTSDSEEYL